ncbi:hypothetical protein C5167_046368 [Papaver somniferum]|uniref:Uncharacterized protein n=1 Tax=Papaver somniferum TaxID=3469 RepID=A0A4Y7LGB3_PAPSO|nr:F-box/LRR-repeat protein At3g58930-like [Papaver somniferum]RZC83578.1 hypothetical protein C5167_046368 [Papaver somniferum]
MVETRNEPYSDGDRINRLPDAIIHHILSFDIDTKHVVQTSVLSKRWIHIWKSIPNLNIDRRSFPQGKEHTQRFIYFADMVLRDDSDIRRFHLHWDSFDHDDENVANNVNMWIVHAVKRNVQQVIVEICQYYHHLAYEIPHQLLNCKSLRTLRIQLNAGARHAAQVTFPKLMDLPRLEVLSLAGFSVYDVELSLFMLSTSPRIRHI